MRFNALVTLCFSVLLAPVFSYAADGADNALYVDGKQFFPIGIYHVKPGDYPELASKKINTVQAFLNEESILAARKYGLKVLGVLYPHSTIDPDYITKAVTAYANVPEIISWYLIDEPDLRGISPSKVKEGYDLVKRLDARRPVFHTVARPPRYGSYRGSFDVLAEDVYPVPDSKIRLVSESVRRAIAAAGGTKPVWAAIQAAPKKKNKRSPTPAEVRAMVYAALISGARGILYYAFTEGDWSLRDDKALWEEIGRINAEIGRLVPVLTGGVSLKTLSIDNPAVISDVREVDGRKYILAVNVSKKTVRARLTLANPPLHGIRNLFQGTVLPPPDGTGFTDTFESLETKVYEVE